MIEDRKTLKDIEKGLKKDFLKYKEIIDKGRGIDEREWLVMLGYIVSCFKFSKKEAIKWYHRSDDNKHKFIREFFNITEDDLK